MPTGIAPFRSQAPPAPAPSAGSPRFYRWELDLVRLAAFGLVFCQHALPQRAHGSKPADLTTTLSYAGGFGVRLFFVLSAFLLTRLLLIEHGTTGTIGIRAFYLRRTLRIWPLYFLFVLLCIPVAAGGSFVLPGIEPGHLVPTLTFTLNWWQGLDPPSTTSLSGILWSLAVEEQMYLVWPVLMLALLRRRALVPGLLVLAVAGVAARVAIAAADLAYPAMWVLTPSAFDAFALGGLLAVLGERTSLQLPRSVRIAAPVLAVAVLLAVTRAQGLGIYDGWTAVWSYLLVDILGVTALAAALGNGRRTGAAPASPAVRTLVWAGRRSYGLYVWHRAALALVVATLTADHANRFWLLPVALALTLAAAAVSYRLVERPFLRLKARLAAVASAPAG